MLLVYLNTEEVESALMGKKKCAAPRHISKISKGTERDDGSEKFLRQEGVIGTVRKSHPMLYPEYGLSAGPRGDT